MRHPIQILLIVAIILCMFILAVLLTMAEYGLTAGPSASPSPTATPTPPASAATVRAALTQRRRAQRTRTALCRVRDCFGSRHPVRVASAPKRAASEAAWVKAGRRWRHAATDWAGKVQAGRYAMTHPGGNSNGARWKPLARWVGWPERAIHTLTGMIWFESSGRERAFNDVIDCTGLCQVWPKHVTDRTGMSWSAAIRWLMVAENNLRESLRIWKSQGGHFKPAWAGDPAVEAVE